MSYSLKFIVALVMFTLAVPVSRGDDAPNPDQLKRMYDDTLSQLKETQQRKTQLAADNEQLKARIAELEQQVHAQQAKVTELAKQNTQMTEREFFLQSHYAAWQEFLHHFPRFEQQWKAFLQSDQITPSGEQPMLVDPYWPWSAQA